MPILYMLQQLFFSFDMNLMVVMNSGAGNTLLGFEIVMFYFFLKFYFFTNPKIASAAGTKCYETM